MKIFCSLFSSGAKYKKYEAEKAMPEPDPLLEIVVNQPVTSKLVLCAPSDIKKNKPRTLAY